MMQAAPAYTAVATRTTLQRPEPPPESKPVKFQWPPTVREYVSRAFAEENKDSRVSHEEMLDKLKSLITRAAEEGDIELIDWSTYPLPQQIIQSERVSYAPRAIGINFDGAMDQLSGSMVPTVASRKRKSSDMDFDDSPAQSGTQPPFKRAVTPPWHKKDKKQPAPLEDRMSNKAKRKEKKQKQSDEFRASVADSKLPEAIEKRRQRFDLAVHGGSPYLSPRDDSPNPNNGPVVGTCSKIEKSYFRLTSAPKPETVRPFPILEQALDLVRMRWKQDHNYHYACDQLKSIRQDLTVQHIKTEFTVKVYEAHARIALEMQDMGEYNQCQTQLRALYKLNLGGNPEEFMAYRILYFIYTCNRTDMNDVLADLTPTDKAKPGVQHALQVRSALAAGNYHKFFRLYDEAPFMGPYLLDMIVQRERLAALATICKAYKPAISLHVLAKELAFHGEGQSDDSDLDAGARECSQFICEQGGEHLLERQDNDVRLNTAKAGSIFDAAKSAAFRRVDIKGQI